jgi:hypothetical protein
LPLNFSFSEITLFSSFLSAGRIDLKEYVFSLTFILLFFLQYGYFPQTIFCYVLGMLTQCLFITYDKLIPKPILYSTNNNIITVLRIKDLINNLEHKIHENNFEFLYIFNKLQYRFHFKMLTDP